MPSPSRTRTTLRSSAAAAVAAAASGSSKSRSWRSSLAVSRHSPSGDHLTPFTQLFGSVASRNSSQQPQIASVLVPPEAGETLALRFRPLEPSQ